MTTSSNRHIALALSEIHEAMRDIALLMNATEGEHRTMKLSGAIAGLERGAERIRQTLDYGRARKESEVAERVQENT